jgi:hypothetical protein
VPLVPVGRPDDDDQFLALAALLLSGQSLGAERPEDDLSVVRRRRFEEHALAKARHPSAKPRRSA